MKNTTALYTKSSSAIFALLIAFSVAGAPQQAEASWLSSLKKKLTPAPIQKVEKKIIKAHVDIAKNKFNNVKDAVEFKHAVVRDGAESKLRNMRRLEEIHREGVITRAGLATAGAVAPIVVGTAGAVAGGAIGAAGAVAGTGVAVATHTVPAVVGTAAGTAGVVAGTAIGTAVGTAGVAAGTAGAVAGTGVAVATHTVPAVVGTAAGTAGVVAGTAGAVAGTGVAVATHTVPAVVAIAPIVATHEIARETVGNTPGARLLHDLFNHTSDAEAVRNDIGATGGVEVASIEINPSDIPTEAEIAANVAALTAANTTPATFTDETPITTGMVNDGRIVETKPGTVIDKDGGYGGNPNNHGKGDIKPEVLPVLVGATGVGEVNEVASAPRPGDLIIARGAEAAEAARSAQAERQAALAEKNRLIAEEAAAAKEARLASLNATNEANGAASTKAQDGLSAADAAKATQAERQAALAEKNRLIAEEAAAAKEARLAALNATNEANGAASSGVTAGLSAVELAKAAQAERQAALAEKNRLIAEEAAAAKAKRQAALNMNVALGGSAGPGSAVTCVFNCGGTSY